MGDIKSRERLKKVIHSEVTQLFESALDYTQVACPTPDTYKVLRAKILRVGNNCIRKLQRETDNYEVEYTAIGEEIIEVVRPQGVKI